LLDEFGGPNGDIEVRVAAAEGLGKLRSRESVPSLIAALAGQTTPKEVKKAAVFALGEIGDKRGAEFLREFLGKEEGCLADVVREVLEKLNK
jgi:HEAT repeat protein